MNRPRVFACLRKIAFAGLAWAMVAASAAADPESDRLAIVTLYQKLFPEIALEAYVDGALMLQQMLQPRRVQK